MGKKATEPRMSTEERAVLLRHAIEKARLLVARTRTVLAAAESVLTTLEAVQAANRSGTLDTRWLRGALNHLGSSHRAAEEPLHEAEELADRVLDAVGADARVFVGSRQAELAPT
jgi:hypothetical protein